MTNIINLNSKIFYRLSKRTFLLSHQYICLKYDQDENIKEWKYQRKQINNGNGGDTGWILSIGKKPI